jgi:ubiquinone/menaquinone biosynthesis C-methylase UbiE
MSTTTTAVDFDAIKTKQQANWSAGDYARIGTKLQIIGETLCEAIDVSAGWRVLDVAAGNGNASLAAARRGCDVTAVDYVPDLLGQLQARAAAEGASIDARVGDAEALEFADDTFDAVVSTVGVMFAPNQEAAVSELVRVCRSGGRIVLANWTPQSYVGHLFRTIGKYVPPPAGIRSPLEWGSEARVQELLGNTVSSLTTTERAFVFRYRSATEFIDTMRAFYGPMTKAFEALDDQGRSGLFDDLVALAEERNVATDGTLHLPSEYLEIVAVV